MRRMHEDCVVINGSFVAHDVPAEPLHMRRHLCMLGKRWSCGASRAPLQRAGAYRPKYMKAPRILFSGLPVE